MLKGIDLSTYQKNVDYSKLKKQGIDFAIIRCGYGKDFNQKDNMFEEHYKGLQEAGIKVGVYHYSYCTSLENSTKEAKYCLELIKGKEFDLPVFYDLEDRLTKVLGKNTITKIALNFCRIIEEAGYKAGVYANLDWFTNYIDKYALIDEGYKIWLAQWQVSKPTANFPYQFWQYTNSLKIDGIKGKVDGNYCEEKEIIINKPKKEEPKTNLLDSTLELLAIKTINGGFGNGDQRKQNLGDKYYEVQNLVNKILLNNDIEQIALNVIRGNYGNGEKRKQILGSLYEKVQKRVNQILSK